VHSLVINPSVPTDDRFLSEDGCRALSARVFAMATGGGATGLGIRSTWMGNIRWGRNSVSASGERQDSALTISRAIFGAPGSASTNTTDDAALRATMRRAEAMTLSTDQSPDTYPVPYVDPTFEIHPITHPAIWYDRTYQTDVEQRSTVVASILASTRAADLLGAGYIEVAAHGLSVARSVTDPVFRYYPFTAAQCSVTVRDKRGTGSGWAGVDHNDWQRIDPIALAAVALDKCQRSRNPSAIEPGYYTAILEPQAVCDLCSSLVAPQITERQNAEQRMGPYADPNRAGWSRIGQRMLDERITIGADPMDPDCGFIPFDQNGEPYRSVNWFENGVLKELSYDRTYAVNRLGKDWALPNSGAFRMSGGMVTIEEMIASTQRGVLVTRFSQVGVIDASSMLSRGITRDGLWLIEHGNISRPIKNFRFTESPLAVLNNIDQLGVPRRVFRPGAPAICPPLKARDFLFSSLIDAV
jgi:predicted Zn-dependent protease